MKNRIFPALIILTLILGVLVPPAAAVDLRYDINWSTITGTTRREKIVQIAQSQIGYFETSGSDGTSGSQVRTTTAGGHTAYNKYSASVTSWCAWFVRWCANQAGITTDVIPSSGRVDTLASKNEYRTVYARGQYTARPGDLIVFDWNNNGSSDHIELVTAVNGSTYTTIGGSTSCIVGGTKYYYGVGQHSYSASSSSVMSIVAVNYEALDVGATPPESPLAINVTSAAPGAHPLGAPYYFRGSITSTYPITSATVQVLYRGGDVAMESTVYPNKTNVDILKDHLDDLKFGQLGENFYTLRLTATDSSGKTAEWSSDFTVGSPTPPSPPVEPTPESPVEPTPESPVEPTPESPVEPTPEPPVEPTPEPSAETSPTSEPTSKPSALPFAPVKTWSSTQFDDVSVSDWYYQNVKLAYRLDLMKGTHADVFSPLSKVTVAETVTLAARIHALYYDQENDIPRYDGGRWYDGYVDYAADNAIPTKGLHMDNNATRDQFIYILATVLPADELTAIVRQISFMDKEDINHLSAVNLFTEAGVITGVTRNNQIFFQPDSTITRAEAATIITRMVIPELRVVE